MALIDIEYGSLAKSETMNANFNYLENKIDETSESILTSISSILSNIATINTRLNDISDNINDSVETLNSNLEEYKTKTKFLVNKASMVPDWSKCVSVKLTSTSSYTVTSNGYLLILPTTSSKGNLVINNTTVAFKIRSTSDDNSAQLTTIPVFDGDIVSCSAGINNIYFLPNKEISIENF